MMRSVARIQPVVQKLAQEYLGTFARMLINMGAIRVLTTGEIIATQSAWQWVSDNHPQFVELLRHSTHQTEEIHEPHTKHQ